jgi:hypothetical protein
MVGALSSLSLRGGVTSSCVANHQKLVASPAVAVASSSPSRRRVVGLRLRATPRPATATAGAAASHQHHQQQQRQRQQRLRRRQCSADGHQSSSSSSLSTRHRNDNINHRVRFATTTPRSVAGGVLDVQASDDADAASAASNDEADGEEEEPEVSSRDIFAQLVRFTLPTMAIWMCGPILSMVDTSVVGIASTLELAAMSPGGVFVVGLSVQAESSRPSGVYKTPTTHAFGSYSF